MSNSYSNPHWLGKSPYRVMTPVGYRYFDYRNEADEAAFAYGSAVELSPGMASEPPRVALGGEHPAGEPAPSPEPWVGPTPGNLEAYDYADGVLGEQ